MGKSKGADKWIIFYRRQKSRSKADLTPTSGRGYEKDILVIRARDLNTFVFIKQILFRQRLNLYVCNQGCQRFSLTVSRLFQFAVLQKGRHTMQQEPTVRMK